MTSFFDDVNDWLTIGPDLDLATMLTDAEYEDAITALLEHGVTHVLDLRDYWDDKWMWQVMGLPGEHYCHAPIVDDRSHTPPEDWYVAIENFVEGFWKDSCHGDRLYVHCQMGVNRGPTAAMLALLTVQPEMHPWQAFLQVRDARPCAGLVYAPQVGARHLVNSNVETPEEFTNRVFMYWTNQRIAAARAVRPKVDLDSLYAM